MIVSGSPDWHAQVDEVAIDPGCDVIDPHHHLWPESGRIPYSVDDLVADTATLPRLVATVFMECGAAYRTGGPEHLRAVGETEFVAAAADDLSARFPDAAPIAGIVSHANLTDERLDDLLDAHTEASGGRFRGIRDSLARSIEPEAHLIPGFYAEGKAQDRAFRRGVARLGERGLTYDCWMFHHQIPDFADLARSAPGTTMVFDHFGTPVGVGQFAGRHDEIFEQWKDDIADVASCTNTVAKIGGLAMPDNGFGFHAATAPPTSAELVAAQRRWYEHAIECFGPERCMFESNFPVDRLSLNYVTYWNAMCEIAQRYSADERAAMFAGTARRVYRLDV